MARAFRHRRNVQAVVLASSTHGPVSIAPDDAEQLLVYLGHSLPGAMEWLETTWGLACTTFGGGRNAAQRGHDFIISAAGGGDEAAGTRVS